MSGMALNYPRKPFELADDLESFIHVLCWLALRFHTHNLTYDPSQLETVVYSHYEIFTQNADGCVYGSSAKYDAMAEGRVPFRLDPQACANLRDVLQELVDLCKIHYAAVDKSTLVPFGKHEPKSTGLIVLSDDEDAEEFATAAKQSSRKSRKSRKSRTSSASRRNVSSVDDSDAASSSSSILEPTITRVLDSHEEIIQVLRDALATKGWMADKIGDQFVALRSAGTGNFLKPNVAQLFSTANPPPASSTGDSLSRKRKSGSSAGRAAIKQRTGVAGSKARRTEEEEEEEDEA